MDTQNNYTERTEALDAIDRVEALRSELDTTLDRLANYMYSLDEDDPLYAHIYESLEEDDDDKGEDEETATIVSSRTPVLDGTVGPIVQSRINDFIRREKTNSWLNVW